MRERGVGACIILFESVRLLSDSKRYEFQRDEFLNSECSLFIFSISSDAAAAVDSGLVVVGSAVD